MQSWPPAEGINHLHSTILGYAVASSLCKLDNFHSQLHDRMWGMPIGEFFDLEALAKHAAETGRYTFFFSSWPLNVYVLVWLSRTSRPEVY